jgi:hypothetical protein
MSNTLSTAVKKKSGHIPLLKRPIYGGRKSRFTHPPSTSLRTSSDFIDTPLAREESGRLKPAATERTRAFS